MDTIIKIIKDGSDVYTIKNLVIPLYHYVFFMSVPFRPSGVRT